MLKVNKIVVTERDFHYILDLIEKSYTIDPMAKKSHKQLYDHLQAADILKDEAFPKDIIRLNSVVDIQTSFGRKSGLRIVTPDDGDMKLNKLSVLSPIGAAILGFKEGATTEWLCHNTIEIITIEKVVNE